MTDPTVHHSSEVVVVFGPNQCYHNQNDRPAPGNRGEKKTV